MGLCSHKRFLTEGVFVAMLVLMEVSWAVEGCREVPHLAVAVILVVVIKINSKYQFSHFYGCCGVCGF